MYLKYIITDFNIFSIYILLYRDGNKFTKNWSNLLDPGEIIYKNGEKYKGQWNDNFEKHGEGTLYSADGQVISSGNWEWDKYVDNLT